MKIIFLDVDGVLNSMEWKLTFPAGKVPHGDDDIDPAKIELLNKIVEATGAWVVVSSVWRKCRKYPRTELQEILNRFGFKGRILGVTPNSASGIRGLEIQEWLDNYKRESVQGFVIIDDSSDMEHLISSLVRTDGQTGLLQEHVDRAIGMLNRSRGATG